MMIIRQRLTFWGHPISYDIGTYIHQNMCGKSTLSLERRQIYIQRAQFAKEIHRYRATRKRRKCSVNTLHGSAAT